MARSINFVYVAILFASMLLPAAAQAQNDGTKIEQNITPLTMQANALIELMNGGGNVSAHFHNSFLNAVSEQKLRALFATLSSEYGKANKVTSLDNIGSNQAILMVDYDRALVRVEMVIAPPSEQSKITGLYITQTQVKGDGITAITNEIARLDGKSAFGVWRLDNKGDLTLINGHRVNDVMATGSSFKLSILATLDEEIRLGKRRWSDVVPLTVKSLPSGQMQHWPDRSPVTLHSLATMMIAISDNTATDTLLAVLGREKIVAFEKRHNIAPNRQYPMLSTIEAFVLKEDAQAKLRQNWIRGNYASRLALLENNKPLWNPSNAGMVQSKGIPAYINEIEWFYSPTDIAKLMTWFTQNGSPEARAILAVSPGMSASDRRAWKNVGYKGGSEAGVIAMNYLLTAKDGTRYIISGAWNDSAKTVNEQKFQQYMTRTAGLLARQSN